MKQAEALDILKMGHSVYLTGPAGSGKTHLLNEYIKFLRKNKVEVGITASTGIAATHMGGMTIHSWTGIGIKEDLDDWDLDSLSQKSYLAKRFEDTKVLIIDEVSMLHHYRLDLVDKVCQVFKRNNLPFGGMQVILSGDFFQLPPINRSGDEICFINKSQVWRNMNLKICYLEEQFRQECCVLEKILNEIRKNNAGENVLVPLRKCYKRKFASDLLPTKLYTHNIDIDEINNHELDKLEGDCVIFEMRAKGKKNLTDILKKSCLAPEELRLKIGAVVMFLKNNPVKKYVNGTLGKIVAFNDRGLPLVKIHNGKTIDVEPESWVLEENQKIKAELKQIPLRLAWAITVHKSQGMSLDMAEIDLSKSFVEGMGYVALSRVRSLEGLRLMGLNQIALRINKEVLVLDSELIDLSNKVSCELKKMPVAKIKETQENFLKTIRGSFVAQKERPKKISTFDSTRILLEDRKTLTQIASLRKLSKNTIIAHLEKLKESGEKLNLNYLKTGISKSRLEKIKKAFEKSNDKKLAKVKEILGDKFEYDEIRIARLFL